MRKILVNEPKPRLVALSDIITESEAKSLRHFVEMSQSPSGPLELRGATPHKAIMEWINSRPVVRQRWDLLKLLPEYGGYLLEYHLQLK